MNSRTRARHLSRRDFLVCTGAIAAGAAAAPGIAPGAAAAAPARKAPPGGTVTVGHIGDVDNYDPLTDALDQFQNYGRLLIFSSLTTYDADIRARRRPRHEPGSSMAPRGSSNCATA